MNSTLNKRLHTLLSTTGQMANKQNLCFGFSGGKGESSKDLTDAQALEMIAYLQKQKPDDAANKMRRKLISLAYEMHWAKAGDSKKAVAAIDQFCISEKSLFKKPLNAHSEKELVQVVSQFESMYKKYLNRF